MLKQRIGLQNTQAAHDWAMKRRIALEKSESIKAERRKGGVGEKHSFQPTLVVIYVLYVCMYVCTWK